MFPLLFLFFALSADVDDDGHPDWRDNCPHAENPMQRDLDGDSVGDACDEDLQPVDEDEADPGARRRWREAVDDRLSSARCPVDFRNTRPPPADEFHRGRDTEVHMPCTEDRRQLRERFIAFVCATADGISDDAVKMLELGWITRAMVNARGQIGPPEEREQWQLLALAMDAQGYP